MTVDADLHHFDEDQDPDPHQSKKLDPTRIWIHIKVSATLTVLYKKTMLHSCFGTDSATNLYYQPIYAHAQHLLDKERKNSVNS